MTWEEAVKDMRSKPENKQAILDNYFDADINASAERFYRSEEFNALMQHIPFTSGKVLDIGAGRGIAAYAFAKKGFQASALEPDPSNDVGAGAIKYLSQQHGLNMDVVETFGESLPFPDAHFDVVYARQVLHHANDLAQFCKEVYRVLKPGGLFIAVREHVLSQESDLDAFLAKHPLHSLYGGEHAYTLSFYLQCITGAGFRMREVLNPYATVINFAPTSQEQMKATFAKGLAKFTGKTIASWLINVGPVYRLLTMLKAKADHSPGRLYSFIAVK